MDSPSSKRQRYSDIVPTILPEDLIISEILPRLPAKTIGRFRCVSKLYLFHTTDPHFIQTHAIAVTSASSSFFLFRRIIGTAYHFTLNPTDPDADAAAADNDDDTFLSFLGVPARFLDARNGLFLLRNDRGYSKHPRPSALCVCNPTTRSCHFIAKPRELEHHKLSFSDKLYLLFDPSLSPHFKVVSIQFQPQYNIFIYSSDTCRWKLLIHNYNHNVDEVGSPEFTWSFNVVQWNGVLVSRNYPERPLIFIDTRAEQLGSLPLPDFQADEYMCRFLGESRGCLYYIGTPVPATDVSVTNFDVWEMGSGASGWSVLHRIDIDCIKHVYPEVNTRVPSRKIQCRGTMVAESLRVAVDVVCFIRGGEEGGDGDRLLLSIPGKIVSYNVRDKTFITVCDNLPFSRSDLLHSWQRFYTHARTLFTFNNDEPVSNSHDWMYWSREHDKHLVALMVEYALEGERCGSGFKMRAWRDMLLKFNATTNLTVDICHLKNRLLSYRKDFRKVNTMLRWEGFEWDPSAEMVVADEATWKDLPKKDITATVYKRKKVPLKELEIIYGPAYTNVLEN